MHTQTPSKTIWIIGTAFIFMFPITLIAQTFSPYSPAQIQEFNSQPIAPVETPEGPIYLQAPPVKRGPRTPLDAHYVKNPDGEEQAEAQGEESAAPFEPIPATFTY